jgi:anti-sigma factor RsiW
MRCRAARKRLSAYTDGALALYEMVALKEHLSRCTACRRDLEALRGLNRRLANGASAAPMIDWPAFEARLARRLERQKVAIWAGPWYRQAKGRRQVAAAAALALVALGAAAWLSVWRHPSLAPRPDAISDTTLRYEGEGRFQIVAQIVPQAESPPVHGTPGAAPLDGDSLRLSWLAGTDQAWQNGDTTLVSIRYDDPRGEPIEHHYVFQSAPQ